MLSFTTRVKSLCSIFFKRHHEFKLFILTGIVAVYYQNCAPKSFNTVIENQSTEQPKSTNNDQANSNNTTSTIDNGQALDSRNPSSSDTTQIPTNSQSDPRSGNAGNSSNGTTQNMVITTAPIDPAVNVDSNYFLKKPLKVNSIVTSPEHTCGLTGEGKIYCWGTFTYNPTYDGSLASKQFSYSIPQEVLGLSNVKKLQKSTNCIIDDFGALNCWKINEVSGKIESIGNPYPDLPKLIEYTDYYNHSCAITVENDVYCWGGNFHFATGVGTDFDTVKTPTKIDLSGKAIKIATGGNSTCVVTTKNIIRCWGEIAETSYGTLSFYDYPNVGQIVSIEGSFDHFCASTESKTAYCWGFISSSTNLPITLSLNDPRSNFYKINLNTAILAVSVGYELSCFSFEYNKSKCYLPKSKLSLRLPTFYTTEMNLEGTVVSAGMDYVCILDQFKNVSCFGNNEFGTLGSSISTYTLKPISKFDGTKVEKYLSNDQTECILDTIGKVYCRSLGMNGKFELLNTSSSVPIVDIAATSNSICTLDSSSNFVCPLYSGNANNSVTFKNLVKGKKFRSIVAGLNYYCLLTSDDQVFCDGSYRGSSLITVHGLYNLAKASSIFIDKNDRLCAVTKASIVLNHDYPVNTAFDPEQFYYFKESYTAKDGELYCLGSLGSGNFIKPTLISLPDLVFSVVDGGKDFYCGKTNANFLACIGSNSNGLSNVSVTKVSGGYYSLRSNPVNSIVQSISTSEDGGCAVTGNKEAICWGDRSPVDQSGMYQSPTKIQLSNVEKVFTTKTKTIFVDTNGVLYWMGYEKKIFTPSEPIMMY